MKTPATTGIRSDAIRSKDGATSVMRGSTVQPTPWGPRRTSLRNASGVSGPCIEYATSPRAATAEAPAIPNPTLCHRRAICSRRGASDLALAPRHLRKAPTIAPVPPTTSAASEPAPMAWAAIPAIAMTANPAPPTIATIKRGRIRQCWQMSRERLPVTEDVGVPSHAERRGGRSSTEAEARGWARSRRRQARPRARRAECPWIGGPPNPSLSVRECHVRSWRAVSRAAGRRRWCGTGERRTGP